MKLQAFELSRGIAILLAIPAGGGVPTEIQLFAKGATETTKGPIVFDEKAAKATMAAFKEYGLDLLPFDVGHGMLGGVTPDAHKAFGWFKPAVRDGGLWATDIEWTPAGKTALENREFRFFSPAVMRDFDSGRVMELINVALTNIPATKGQKPLVADNTGTAGKTGVPMDELEKLLKLLGLRSGDELLSRWSERSTLEQKVLSVTGEQNVPAALAKLDNLKIQATESVKLAARVTELEGSIANATRDAKIAELSKAGKLPPSLHALAKTFTLEQLSAFEAAAPALPASGEAGSVKEPATQLTQLSQTELEVCSQLGVEPAKFLAEKTRLAQAAQMGA